MIQRVAIFQERCKGKFRFYWNQISSFRYNRKITAWVRFMDVPRTLSALAKFDLANQAVRQPVQLHTFNAQLPVFKDLSAA